MNKLRGLLNFIEEKILFRFGKRSWQIISIIAIGMLVYAISLYIWNAVPSSREEVKISKMEFDKNEIDTDFDESNNVDACAKADYQKVLDSLKRAMSNSEWKKLGDSVEVDRYRWEEVYDPYWDFTYPQQIEYTEMEYRRNPQAIPNILDDIFEYKGIDSSQFCQRIKVLRMLIELNSYTSRDQGTNFLQSYHRNTLIYNGHLNLSNIKAIVSIFEKIEGHKPRFKELYNEKDDLNQFSRYVDYFRNDSITGSRIETINESLNKIKGKGILKTAAFKHKISEKILESSLSDADIKAACNDFFSSSEFKYTDKSAVGIFYKYHRLYSRKVRLAEELLAEEQFEKELNRQHYYELGILSFASVLSIATILLLFSIRGILKEKQQANN
jgi:hypothetical protein